MTASRQRAAILRALTDDRLGLRIAQVHRGYTLLVTALDLARDDPQGAIPTGMALQGAVVALGRPQRSSAGDWA
jgi:hypothetical protein